MPPWAPRPTSVPLDRPGPGQTGEVSAGMTWRGRRTVGPRPAGRPSPAGDPLPQVTARWTQQGRRGRSEHREEIRQCHHVTK